MSRLPPWIRTRVRVDGCYAQVHNLIRKGALHTVCESAQCPNRPECFGRGTATFMILGDRCVRNCRFCAVNTGDPLPLDPDEPERVAAAVAELRLKHAVITSVTRDDLDDGGAAAFAATIRAIRERAGQHVTIEVLTPDFQGNRHDIRTVAAAGPDVFNHNLETVRRLQPKIRPQADYTRSLAVLRCVAGFEPRPVVKSGIMAGLGETDDELYEAMRDLRSAGCEVLTVGQYLAPSREHWPVARFVHPETFEVYANKARAMGFKAVASGPLVRSSYRAGETLRQARQE